MKITFIYPHFRNVIEKEHIPMYPLGIGVLAALTPDDIDVAFYDDRLEEIPVDEPTDLAAIAIETYNASRAYEIAAEYRQRSVPVIMGGIHTRVARSTFDYRSAFSLVKQAYSERGYSTKHIKGMRILPQHVLPEATVLVALDRTRIVGTLTVIVDSPVGLPIEEAYPDEIQELRGRGARLVEYSSLAVAKGHRRKGVTRLLFMMANYLAFSRFGCSHCTIGVIPRAAPFYRALFDFRPLGAPFKHDELGCSGVGLFQDLERVRSFARRHYRRKSSAGQTVFEIWDNPPPNVERPPEMSEPDWRRWKMPPSVFRQLFIRETNMLESLAPDVLEYLRTGRSPATTEAAVAGAAG